MPAHPHLFRPGRIGRLALPNRIVLAALSTNSADPEGGVTPHTLEFYRVRARGGAALCLVEATIVQPTANATGPHLAVWDDRHVPGLATLARTIREHGSIPVLQLFHGGPKAPGRYNGGARPVSASAVPLLPGEEPRPLTLDEIAGLVADFARGAARAREAGFDGVELHAAHFYLLSAFSSPHTNHRTDAYGGSVENRGRLLVEIARAVKAAAGREFPVLVKMNVREELPDGITVADAAHIARALEAEGVDAIETSSYVNPHTRRTESIFTVKVTSMGKASDPVAVNAGFAGELRQHLGIPVICVGRVTSAEVGEAVLAAGKADFVAMGRALVADPYLPRKTAEGRADEVVPCTASLYCYMTLMRGEEIRCAINKNLYGEPEYDERLVANRHLLKTTRPG
jgi:2,4-dienoyl-CoA reductase-like NADH-dependent reductase (Old Yellow Enzyme family)